MSSDTLTRVQAFSVKADELADKGHVLRAAENYGRAAEAARALGADNLVALHMLALQGSMLGCHAVMALEDTNVAVARIGVAHRAESIALLSRVLEALDRRRVAGTLLEGKCTVAEEAWRALVYLQQGDASAEAVSRAELVGYEEFLNGSISALGALGYVRIASERSGDQLQTFVQHIVHAAELMQQPRRHGYATLRVEVEFADMLRRINAAADAFGLDTHLVQLLAGAWQRIQRSGVLQARHINDEHTQEAARGALEFGTAVLNSRAAPGLRSCALPGCGAKEAHPAHFKSCAACRTVVYCCREHQVAGWPAHKKACKAARKAASAKDEAGPSGA